ncbi:hypothetical protein EJ08DRAFT_701433 [Tothia fuscella]|uniref:Uncharacterized protein n=1 Tax=Tothia fuscella TaxID=1048955 RepID=A0A9P4NII7_9PEZI|nr:hypothetical protein EJ08DRAFT_701433 [Tothia fuscella]
MAHAMCAPAAPMTNHATQLPTTIAFTAEFSALRFGRFLPTPRVYEPYNTTVARHMRPRVVEYKFAAVWRIPTGGDVWAPVEEIADPDVIASLLNKDLLDAMDDRS